MTDACDVVVIGGGILGAATTHRLVQSGLSVTLLERGPVNREGSGTTAGNLHIQAIHTRRPGQDVPVDNVRFLSLQVAASELWDETDAELDHRIELRRGGGFMVAETPDQVAELEAKHVHEAAHGVPTELLDGDEARSRLPLLGPGVTAASWCPLDGYVNPLLVTPAWLGASRAGGADIRPFTPVDGLERAADDSWHVHTSTGVVRADAVVVVAGPWCADVLAMAGVQVELAPVAIQMLVTERIDATLGQLVQHIGEGLSMKQVDAGQILIGGGWPAADLDLQGRSRISHASARGNLREAVRILPFLRDLRILRMWAGPLAATTDEMPVIGPVPDQPGLFMAAGTYAFTLAPLWASVLASMVQGERPIVDVKDLGVDRLLGHEVVR